MHCRQEGKSLRPLGRHPRSMIRPFSSHRLAYTVVSHSAITLQTTGSNAGRVWLKKVVAIPLTGSTLLEQMSQLLIMDLGNVEADVK